jgi:ABC-type amino acid transport system permease subunit
MSEDVLADEIRKRIQVEDELLNSRTTIFLATNGLWAAAAGISTTFHLQIGIGILGVLVSTMWVMCSWQSWKVIRSLTRKYLKSLKGQPEDQAEYKVEKTFRMRSGGPDGGQLTSWRNGPLFYSYLSGSYS